MDLKHYIGRYLSNIGGYKTDRKLLIIESDDWGSIRTPKLQDRYKLINEGVLFSNSRFEYVDTLANSDDFDALFSLLSRYRDCMGNTPKITANVILANPDFDKIKKNNYSEYYYETFVSTLEKYYPNESVFDYWKDGIKANIFLPQFHAREHINAYLWLKFLRLDKTLQLAADYGFYSAWVKNDPSIKFLQAFNIREEEEKEYVKKSINEGLQMFKNLMGFESASFIAPSYIWDSYVEDCLFENNVYYIQGMKGQKTSILDGNRLIKHKFGERNKNGQYYLCRNVLLEPALGNVQEQLKKAINDINIAFFCHKPVVISMHRLNFIGSLDVKNRNIGLECLKQLLEYVLSAHPTVEFFTTEELGNLVSNK